MWSTSSVPAGEGGLAQAGGGVLEVAAGWARPAGPAGRPSADVLLHRTTACT